MRITDFVVMGCMCVLLLSCNNRCDDYPKQSPAPQQHYEQVRNYQSSEPSCDDYNSVPADTTLPSCEINTIDTNKETEKIEEKKKITSVKLSAAYIEGFERGYDDGYDDVINRNGWHGQYDPSNHYKGKKRRDYILGYDEGYESGYEDNVEEDGRSSDWDDME